MIKWFLGRLKCMRGQHKYVRVMYNGDTDLRWDECNFCGERHPDEILYIFDIRTGNLLEIGK